MSNDKTVNDSDVTVTDMPQATQEVADEVLPTEVPVTENPQPEENIVDETSAVTEPPKEKQDKPDKQEESVMSDNTASKYSFYIVKSGDNLGSISEKIFQSVKYVQKIKELNNLEDENVIYEGQKLWIPEK